MLQSAKRQHLTQSITAAPVSVMFYEAFKMGVCSPMECIWFRF